MISNLSRPGFESFARVELSASTIVLPLRGAFVLEADDVIFELLLLTGKLLDVETP